MDIKLLQKVVEGFLINATLNSKAREVESQYDCNIPWAILMDQLVPATSLVLAVGLHSTGIKTTFHMR